MEVLPSTNIFALLPGQEKVLLFDYGSDCFMITELSDSTGPHVRFTYDKFRKISGIFEWSVAKIVKREQRIFLFALVVEVRSTRMFLVSYEIGLAEAHLGLVQEHNLDIKSYKIKSFSCDIQVSERERLGHGPGELHCVFHYLDEETEEDNVASRFSIVCVHIDNFGHIHSKKLFKNFVAIAGHWRAPFLTYGRIYSIIGDQIPEKMAEIQMCTDMSDDPIISVSRLRPHQSATGAFPPQTRWSRPTVATNVALWYMFDESTGCGECWNLDIRTKQWAKVWQIHANHHAVSHNLTVEFRPPSNVMLLYGECRQSSCDKPHIHSIQLQREIGESVELNGNQESHVETNQLKSATGHRGDTGTTPNSAVSCSPAEPEAADDRCACVVCMENTPNVLFLPCKHLVLCLNCANRAGRICPYCRSVVLQKINGCFLPA